MLCQPGRDGEDHGPAPQQVASVGTTNATIRSTSAALSIRSILLTTRTIFFPHSRMRVRNWCSLSVNGRSALVTKSTRSLRGTNSSVISWWRWMMALVPGVSTRLISCSHSIGCGTGHVVDRRFAGLDAAPYRRTVTWVVVGVTPSGSKRWPSSALMKADLPALNSPTTTSRKSSSSWRIARSSCAISSDSASSAVKRMAQRHQLAALGLQDPFVILGQKAIQHCVTSFRRPSCPCFTLTTGWPRRPRSRTWMRSEPSPSAGRMLRSITVTRSRVFSSRPS